MISLPFTRDQFLDVFAAYNQQLWPVVLLLWLATVCALGILFLDRPAATRFINVLLTVQWAWGALAYHAAFFSGINSAAWMFGGAFLIQAGLFVWHGMVHQRLRFSRGLSFRHRISWLLLLYALAYPALALIEGTDLPRSPTFGVPCPTTILTIGLLLAVDRLPIDITVIPILWAFVGGSAAFLLDVRTDLMLLVTGPVMLSYVIASRMGDRRK